MLKKISIISFFLLLIFTLSATAQVQIAIVKGDYMTLRPESYALSYQPYDSAAPGEWIDSVLGIFYVEYQPAGDFGHTQVDCELTSDTLWRASRVWDGVGRQEIPPEEAFIIGLDYGYPVIYPDSVHIYLDYYATEDDYYNALAFWDTIKTSFPIYEVSKDENYEVLILNHYYSVGMTDPYSAEWVAIAVSKPYSYISEVTEIDFHSGIQAYPNPFKNTVSIKISGINQVRLNATLVKKLQIFDLAGKLVKEYNIPSFNPGYFYWDGTDEQGRTCASGIYLLTLDTNNYYCYKINYIK